jgi:WD40 repeat protein
MNQLKYISAVLFLFLNVSAFSQTYIEPITSKRLTANLAEGADSMTLEKILGDGKFAVPNRIWDAAYSPDGNYIVIGGYNYIACFNQKTGKKIWGYFVDLSPEYPVGNPIRSIAIHQKINRLVFGADDGKVYLLNFETGEIQRILIEKMGWIMAVTISPDGRFAATTDIKGDYKMWDLETGICLDLPKTDASRGEAVCFSNDGRFLAIGFGNTLHLMDWDNQTSEKYDVPSTVQSIAFINNDKEILISGWTGYVQRIHLKSKKVLWNYNTSDWIINLKLLPDQTSALAISPYYVLHLDWENDKVTTTNISVRTAMDLHPDGKTILTVGACVIHPEAKMVAVTAWDGLVYIYRW